jgi:hypothetical protein
MARVVDGNSMIIIYWYGYKDLKAKKNAYLPEGKKGKEEFS